MLSGNAILFSEMTPDAAWEGVFNSWYDQEHIPLRMACEGFRSAQRFHNNAPDSRSDMAVYELDSLVALSTPAYRVVKQHPSPTAASMLGGVTGFTRYLCERIGDQSAETDAGPDSAFIYAVWFHVPEDMLAEFDAWYSEDHVPLLLRCKDWLRVRRFRVTDGQPGQWNRLAIHHLASALESPERAEARVTPWRNKLAVLPWFRGEYQIFSRLGSRQIGDR